MFKPLPDDLAESMNEVGQLLSKTFKPQGFALFVFDMGSGGNMNYISNANREDMLTAMKEFIAVAEGRRPDTVIMQKQ